MEDRQTVLRRAVLRYRVGFFDLAYALPIPGLSFFNLGVTPVPAHVLETPEGRREPHQVALYDLIAAAVEKAGSDHRPLVELSAGKGAGAAYLKRRLGREVLPLEPSIVGRVATRLRYGLPARYAYAPHLPLPDGEAGALVTVESAHNYMTPEFAREAWRVLAPGGILAIADFPLIPPRHQARIVPTLLADGDFTDIEFTDLTQRVIAACEADSARKKRLFRWLPAPLRREAETSFSVDPSPRLASFRDGRRGYYLVVARKG